MQRRKDLEGAKKRKRLFFATLRALASLREIVYFFTASLRRGPGGGWMALVVRKGLVSVNPCLDQPR